MDILKRLLGKEKEKGEKMEEIEVDIPPLEKLRPKRRMTEIVVEVEPLEKMKERGQTKEVGGSSVMERVRRFMDRIEGGNPQPELKPEGKSNSGSKAPAVKPDVEIDRKQLEELYKFYSKSPFESDQMKAKGILKLLERK